MRSFLKLFGLLAAVSVVTFVLMRYFEVITLTQIRNVLASLQDQPTYLVGLVLASLLITDLILTVPSTATIILAGYLLGPKWGPFYACLGTLAAGLLGYALGRRFGDSLLKFLLRSASEREAAVATYDRVGPAMILVSRAVPMLPEIASCLAGLSKMSFWRFCFLYGCGTIPYTLIVALAGAFSSEAAPAPALIAVAVLNLSLWLSWRLLSRRTPTAN